MINDKIIEFKTNFAGKDMQDYIAMVVLWYATTATRRGETVPDTPKESVRKIQVLDNALLDQTLEK